MRHDHGAGVLDMAERDNDNMLLTTERFERRLGEETGKLRVDMAEGFGEVRTEMAEGLGQVRTEMAAGFGQLRTEMSDRNAELLKWVLVFFATQTAIQTTALGALLVYIK